MKQLELFEFPKKNKSYRAIRHDVVRFKQKNNCNSVHHPHQKTEQVIQVLQNLNTQVGHNILELFAGQGNLTEIYKKYGNVTACDKKYLGTGDSFLLFHKMIYEKKKFTIIDIDPYGFPNRFFPDIYLLLDNGILFVTMPKPYVNILNGITQTHLISYFKDSNPCEETIIEQIATWGLCHWREVTLIDSVDLQSIWRFAFYVKRVKATEYTGVRNR
tara:strand:+ start:70 stop:717 length:648 start_codon:yes stop_codon:yes gene_type:complete